jgi:ornithine carbamoyltransferase
MPRHFLDLHLLPTETLREILDNAVDFKRLKGSSRNRPQPLAGKTLVLIFEKPSTRTRVSFEVGMRELGGNVIVLSDGDMQLGRGETIADTARVLSRYADAIMLRTDSPDKLAELAQAASVPVINGLTESSHPCQIMADVMTFEEKLGPIAGRTVAWIGDGNNVALSWLHAAVRFGFSLRLASPAEYALPSQLVSWARKEGADVTQTRDPAKAAKDADCVVTDTWVSMGDEAQRTRRLRAFKSYQVNARIMAAAKRNALFMHCLPAHRGEEVTDEVIDGAQSVVWDEAENRLHAQKGILAWCLQAH